MTSQPLDKYALAALGAFHDIGDAALMLAEWESMAERDRETWRSVADAVLMTWETRDSAGGKS